VGAAAAYYLAQEGAILVGIIDRAGGLIKETGFSKEEVTTLFEKKQGNSLVADELLEFEEVNARIWDVSCDVFLPCAASRLVNEDQVSRLVQGGLKVISSGANVPFADDEIFYGAIAEKADQTVAVIPDFIANCGMARVFAYLMSDAQVDMSDEGIFSDTSETIRRALQATHARNGDFKMLSATAFEIALDRLMNNA
jgi:glutamate dehydrogenase/leucine dehydrogenase